MKHTPSSDQQGFALVTVLLLMALLMSMLVGYFALTSIDMSTTQSTIDSSSGFYAAEAGLNIRAESIRSTFIGYNRPSGPGPDSAFGTPCEGFNAGYNDFACSWHSLSNHRSQTYVNEDAGNPSQIVIPRGEPYQNLNAQEYLYTLSSVAYNGDQDTEAILEMQLKSRLVPLFQFAAFYNKDLEILPGPTMTLAGPVHVNGDLYMQAGAALNIHGQVTTTGDLYRGRKNNDSCSTRDVNVIDPGSLRTLPSCASGNKRYHVQDSDVTAWNGMIQMGVDEVTIPAPEALDPTPGQTYWDKADIRIMLNLHSGTPVVEIRNPDGTVDALGSAALIGCSGATSYSNTFYNSREDTLIDMLEVDLDDTLDCIHSNSLLMGSRQLDDSTEGGLVFYLGVDGPNDTVVNSYGVRVSDGAELASSVAGAPTVQGMTVVTNQAMYTWGDFNSVNKKPAAFLGDSLNVLSNNWDDSHSYSGGVEVTNRDLRPATDTTINAAFLGGTDLTGGSDGTAGQDSGNYNGGLENYPRFHEKWSGKRLTYRGSFVSLNVPRHVDGTWSSQIYSPPIRDWGYDTDFNDAANLPPLSPRFVYLRQELFVRQFNM
ncbi:hypothetical protein ABI59_15825 [Acidobacteria bacterium Mor1]|nr:hypothetical protein ABI59_15825 [Acidobacteria bacterium Mor1]